MVAAWAYDPSMSLLHAPLPREAILGPPAAGRLAALRRPLALLAIALLLAIAAAAAVAVVRARAGGVTYQTVAPVQRTLVQSVTATGTVVPQDSVTVGTQVSGTIAELLVDYNSRVRKGQILARIDPTLAQAAVDQASGALAQATAQLAAAESSARAAASNARAAQANASAGSASARAAGANAFAQRLAVAAADADVAKAGSALQQASRTVARDRALVKEGYIAQSQVDTDATALAAARATLRSAEAAARQTRAQATAGSGSAEASVSQSAAQREGAASAAAQRANAEAVVAAQRAAVAQQRAQLEQARTNFAHTVIVSPVDGTVIARNVSVGQTVAASFQTPILFTIARNLGKMEVDAAVGEPDVGNVRVGQTATFTVLAYPGRSFTGKVAMVRQNPTTVQNVVTYTTVFYVDNAQGLLRPGMTANVAVRVARAGGATVVPTQALSYVPAAAPRPGRSAQPAARGSQWGSTAAPGTSGTAAQAGQRGRLYVLRGGKPVAIPVDVVLVAGSDAAIRPRDAALRPGDAVIVADSSSAQRSAASSPFVGGPGGPGGVRMH